MPLTRVAARVLDLAGIAAPASMRPPPPSASDPEMEIVIAQLQHPAWILSRLVRRQPDLDLAPLAGDRVFAADRRFACVCRAGAEAAACTLDDMESDPGWTRDAGPAQPLVLARLQAAARAAPAFKPVRAVPPDPELLERLRGLGYLR